MKQYVFRVVDRGLVKGVPVADAYLLLRRGESESCLLHTCGLSLAPPAVEEIALGLGELGVRVERVAMPSVDGVRATAAARRKAKEATGGEVETPGDVPPEGQRPRAAG